MRSPRRDEEAEINFFQDGIARRIADEYLGFAVADAPCLRSDNNNAAGKLSPFLCYFDIDKLEKSRNMFN